jgi:hypothetical protein
MDVPLKFDEFVDSAEQGGGGGAGQVRLVGEKLISIVLNPTKEAVPENVKVSLNVGNEPLTVSPNFPFEGAVKVIECSIGKPAEPGVTSIVYLMVYFVPGTRADAVAERR